MCHPWTLMFWRTPHLRIIPDRLIFPWNQSIKTRHVGGPHANNGASPFSRVYFQVGYRTPNIYWQSRRQLDTWDRLRLAFPILPFIAIYHHQVFKSNIAYFQPNHPHPYKWQKYCHPKSKPGVVCQITRSPTNQVFSNPSYFFCCGPK